MNFLGKYSNGWGHLILSSIIFVSMVILLALGKVDFTEFIAVVGPFIVYWTGAGIANTIITAKNELPMKLEEPKL